MNFLTDFLLFVLFFFIPFLLLLLLLYFTSNKLRRRWRSWCQLTNRIDDLCFCCCFGYTCYPFLAHTLCRNTRSGNSSLQNNFACATSQPNFGNFSFARYARNFSSSSCLIGLIFFPSFSHKHTFISSFLLFSNSIDFSHFFLGNLQTDRRGCPCWILLTCWIFVVFSLFHLFRFV